MVWSLFVAPSAGAEMTKDVNISVKNSVTFVDEGPFCDYERNCIKLYKMIEAKEWVDVKFFLDNGKWPGDFFADTITPAEQAQCRVFRYDSKDPNKVRWSQLCLHLAIIVKAPIQILETLVKVYPDATRIPDDMGMLPLHLAIREGSPFDVVKLLRAASPDLAKPKTGGSLKTPNEVEQHNDEMKLLKISLRRNESDLSSIHSKLDAIGDAKTTVDSQIQKETTELKASLTTEVSPKAPWSWVTGDKELESKLESEREIILRIEQLEAERRELEEAEHKAKEEEAMLRKKLEVQQVKVVESTGLDDLDSVKEEIKVFNAYRQEHSRTDAMFEIKKQLEEEKKISNAALKQELVTMRKKIEEIKSASNKPKSELSELKSEIAALRNQILQNDVASKMNLITLDSVNSPKSKTQNQIDALNSAVVEMNAAEIKAKTTALLSSMINNLGGIGDVPGQKDEAEETREVESPTREEAGERVQVESPKHLAKLVVPEVKPKEDIAAPERTASPISMASSKKASLASSPVVAKPVVPEVTPKGDVEAPPEQATSSVSVASSKASRVSSKKAFRAPSPAVAKPVVPDVKAEKDIKAPERAASPVSLASSKASRASSKKASRAASPVSRASSKGSRGSKKAASAVPRGPSPASSPEPASQSATEAEEEVFDMRDMLRDMEEAAKMRSELGMDRKILQAELKSPTAKKSSSDVVAVKDAINAMKASALESMSKDELQVLKYEVDRLRAHLDGSRPASPTPSLTAQINMFFRGPIQKVKEDPFPDNSISDEALLQTRKSVSFAVDEPDDAVLLSWFSDGLCSPMNDPSKE